MPGVCEMVCEIQLDGLSRIALIVADWQAGKLKAYDALGKINGITIDVQRKEWAAAHGK